MILKRSLLNLDYCNEALLKEVGPLKERIDKILDGWYNSCSAYYHQFLPEGATAFYLLEKKGEPGHLAVHTWPEERAATLDLLLPEGEDSGLLEAIKEKIPACYWDIRKHPLSQRRLGIELLGDYIGVTNYFTDEEKLKKGLKEISREAGFKVLGEVSRQGSNYVSGAMVLSESHFSLHYFPEQRTGWTDIFTCSREGNPFKAHQLLKEKLKPASFSLEEFKR